MNYKVDSDAIVDPQGNVMEGTDEFVQEMQGLCSALLDLYYNSSLLRMCIQQFAPKLKAFSIWEKHAESMKKAEAWLQKNS